MASSATDLILITIDTLEDATRHYNSVEDDKNLLESFHEAGRLQRLVIQALQTTNTHLSGSDLAGDTQSAMVPLEAGRTKAELSKSIFNAVAKAPETSRVECYKKSVKEEGRGRTVGQLVAGMMTDICTLAENDAIRAVMEDQVEGLRRAIDKLSKMELPVPKDDPLYHFANHGPGDQLIALKGNVSKNETKGNNFTGANFSGSVSFGNN